MFTGIVEAIGNVLSLQKVGGDSRLVVGCAALDMTDVVLGESIAVSGCCLTVVQFDGQSFAADVSNETLRCTTLGTLRSGDRVNLERAMPAAGRLGGHIVSGHVDGVGEICGLGADGESLVLQVKVPDTLNRYIAAKGSITMDGTSLTVNSVEANTFAVNIIPHTRQHTIIGDYTSGTAVNIEVDLVARYLERMLQTGAAAELSSVTLDKLRASGLLS